MGGRVNFNLCCNNCRRIFASSIFPLMFWPGIGLGTLTIKLDSVHKVRQICYSIYRRWVHSVDTIANLAYLVYRVQLYVQSVPGSIPGQNIS